MRFRLFVIGTAVGFMSLFPASHAMAQCLDDSIEIVILRHESFAGFNDATPLPPCFVEDSDLSVSFDGNSCPNPNGCSASVSGTFSNSELSLSFSATAEATTTGSQFAVFAGASTTVTVRAVGGDLDYVITVNGAEVEVSTLFEDQEHEFQLGILEELVSPTATPQNPVTEPQSVEITVIFKRRCVGACVFPDGCIITSEELCLFKGNPLGASYLGDDTTCPEGDIRWKEPAGGPYETPANWEPAIVPVHNGQRSDTALFPLSGPGGAAIPISAQNATAGAWKITGAIDLNGSAKLLGAGTTQNTLSLFDGGSLLLDAAATLESKNTSIGNAANAAAQGPQVHVRDDGTLWKSTAEVLVSDVNGAKLIVEEGAKVEAPLVSAGFSLGTTGTIEVRGPAGIGITPSTLKVTNTLRIGKSAAGLSGGIGSLLIEGGGRVETANLAVGNNEDNDGEKVSVSGFNGPTQRSTLEVTTGDLDVVGDAGTQLVVKDGARLATKNAFVGAADGQSGNAEVLVNNSDSDLPRFDPFTQEGGSFWEADGTITVSGNGDAEIVVEDRGLITAINVVLGNLNDEEGQATITDSGSVLAVREGLTIARNGGTGSLHIGGGGLVTCRTCTVGELDSPGSEGEVLLRSFASPAELRVAEDMNVGASIASGRGRVILDALPFIGDAIVTVGGTLTVGPQGGISGNGVLAVPPERRVVLAGGFIAPGLSPGQITIEGDFEQTEAGTLIMEAAGADNAQFDVLTITGNAKLAGTLLITFIDGYVPQEGDVLPFVQVEGMVEGQFTTIQIEGLPEGIGLSLDPLTGELNVLGGPPAGQTVCGTGACGSGNAGMLPVALLGLVGVRIGRTSSRLRYSASNGCRPPE